MTNGNFAPTTHTPSTKAVDALGCAGIGSELVVSPLPGSPAGARTVIRYEEIAMTEEDSGLILPVNTYGQISYGEGSIDGSACSVEQFRTGLTFIRDEALVTLDEINKARHERGLHAVSSILDIPGNCMDGRKNKETLAGNEVEIARPKVMGGPVLFMTYIQGLLGRSSGQTLIGTFQSVAEKNKYSASMHEACGAARGFSAVMQKMRSSFDDINEIMFRITDGKMSFTPEEKERIIGNAAGLVEQADKERDTFNEQAMIDVVKAVAGLDAVMKLEVDPDHENHSHTEEGIVYLWGADGHDYIMVKDKVHDNPDTPNVFYQNAAYAKRLVKENIGRLDPDLMLAQKLAIALPLAAIGVLGKNQHVGTVGKYADLHERMVA